MNTNTVGRPAKIEPFIEALRTVLTADEGTGIPNALICTDEELWILCNEHLDPEQRISYSTFRNYKTDTYPNEHSKEFLTLIKKANIIQKRNLLHRLTTDDKAWTKWAWILERKFDEWNLRSKQELKHEVDPLTAFGHLLPEDE